VRSFRRMDNRPIWFDVLYVIAASSVILCFLLAVTFWPRSACATEPVASGRDTLRCITHRFADAMGPWSTEKALTVQPGPAMAQALQSCNAIKFMAAAGPQQMDMILSGAMVYWMVKD
jgi:hypothetical protein